MRYLINFIKFNILKARLTKLFLVKNTRSLGIIESLALAILVCPKLFLKKRALLLSNKFITFDVLIICYSYACRMLYRNFVLSAEPILLTLIYRGANKLYKLEESDISDISEDRIKIFNNIFFENEKYEVVIDKALQEAYALFSHDLYTNEPTYYGIDTPLTVLPINVYTNLELEANNYLRYMFLVIDNIFGGR